METTYTIGNFILAMILFRMRHELRSKFLDETRSAIDVDMQPKKVRIYICSEEQNFEPTIWNKILVDFHKEIVEPIKDNLEGVQTAIGFPPQKIN